MASSSAAAAPTAQEMAQQIPFPDKFHLAASFMDKYHPVETSTDMSDEHRLAFYSLHKQATQGPCNLPAPSRWYVMDRAKWQAWKDVGHFSPIEAMVFYVQLVEKVVDANWASKIELNVTSDAADVSSTVQAISSTVNTTQPSQSPNWSPATSDPSNSSQNTNPPAQPNVAPPPSVAPTPAAPHPQPLAPAPQLTPQQPVPSAVVPTHHQQPTQPQPTPIPTPTPQPTPQVQHPQQHPHGPGTQPPGPPPAGYPGGGGGLERTPPETLGECQALIRELWEKESAQTRRINDLEVVLQTLQTRVQHKQRECDTLRSHNVSLQSQLQFQQFPRPVSIPTPIRTLPDPNSPQRVGGPPPIPTGHSQPPGPGGHPQPQYQNHTPGVHHHGATQHHHVGHEHNNNAGNAPPSPNASNGSNGSGVGYGLASPRTVHYYSAPQPQHNDGGLWAWVFPWRNRQRDHDTI